MILLAKKEIYRLDIKVGVTGDSETKSKLTATEKMAEQTKRKMQALNKIRASPTAKLNDQASSKLDKLDSKVNKFKSASMTLTAKLKDEASSAVDKIENKTKKIKEANIKVKAQDEASGVINKIENKLNGWIKAGAKKVISLGIAGTIAAGGIGLGTSLKTYSEYEKGLSNVKAVTNATASQMKQLDASAKQYGSTTAWSARHVTQAEELLGQAGFSVEETISALPGLLNLASAGDLDLAAATDIASGTLKAFSLNAKDSSHVADVLALSASATNSDVTDLGEAMKYCAPVSQSLGISLEDTAAAVGLLSNANIKGSQSGTVLRQTMARLASPTSEAAKVMKKYGINAFDAKGNMKPLSGVIDNLNSSLGKLTSQQRADVISTIFGTESMSGVLALMNQGGKSVSDLSRQLKDANGAAQKMSETKLDNLQGQWIKLKAAVEHMQITLGEKLAPYAKQFVTWLTGKMPGLTDNIVKFVDYLSKNTETIKSLGATILGLSIAFTALSAAGKLGNAITGIRELVSVLKGAKAAEETAKVAKGLKEVGIVGKMLPTILSPTGLAIAGAVAIAGTAIATNNDLMKKSLSTTTEELGPVEKIMNKLNGTMYKSKSEMQGLGLAYEDFGNNISDNFKKKVEESTKSIREFQFFINKINLDGAISDSESSEFDSKVNDMMSNAVKTIQDNQAKSQEGMKAMFMDDGTFSEAEKATLEYLSKDYDNKVTREQQIKDEIYNIRQKAVADHGKLYDSEISLIKQKLTEMSQLELESAGGTKDELLYAKNKFAARAQGVDIKDGSALAQEASKDRDSKVVDVKATYDTYLDKLKSQLATANNETDKNNLKSAITENEKARANKIAEINKLWNDDLDTLYKASPNLKGKINKYDGTELTGKDIKSQNGLEKIKSKYADLNNVTQSGFYGIRDSVTGAMNAMYVSVDQRTGDIVGAWNTTTGEVGAYTDGMKQKVKELGNVHQSTIGGAIKYLTDMGASYDIASGKVTNFSGEAIGQLQNLNIAADGTRTGILNLNGTPLQITSNAEGQIISITEVGNSVKNIPPNANVNINSNANGATGELNGTGNAVRNIPESKTITITTIFKKIVQTVEELFSGSNDTPYSPMHKAIGTSFSEEGFSTVDERGWELSQSKSVPILGRYNGDPLTYMSRGTKILNHMQSVQDMKKEVSKQVNSKEVNQPKQIQYQLIQPAQQQVQVAGIGGINFGDIKVSVEGKQDIDNIVTQAAQEFARKLRESLRNIKK